MFGYQKPKDRPCTCVRRVYATGGYDRSKCAQHTGYWWEKVLDKAIIGLIVFAIIAIPVGGVVLARAKAPCSVLDWMPVKDVPARCLTVGHR